VTTRLPILDEVVADVSLMQVGDLAKESGKTVRAIHLYEELAILRPARRSAGGYRLYGPDALDRIRWISKLQDLGFSLPELQQVIRDLSPGQVATSATSRLRDLYTAKLRETKLQRQKLEMLEHELAQSLEYLNTCGDVCEPERLISACTSCELHACDDEKQTVPDLVRGFRAQATHAKF
jgi:MerR family transcriptional regulator, copper efflux regulator